MAVHTTGSEATPPRLPQSGKEACLRRSNLQYFLIFTKEYLGV